MKTTGVRNGRRLYERSVDSLVKLRRVCTDGVCLAWGWVHLETRPEVEGGSRGVFADAIDPENVTSRLHMHPIVEAPTHLAA